jgi:hypothetical protein
MDYSSRKSRQADIQSPAVLDLQCKGDLRHQTSVVSELFQCCFRGGQGVTAKSVLWMQSATVLTGNLGVK